jgi:hypothetical protein
MDSTHALPAAGWYDLPDGTGVGYWNGTDWTSNVMPPPRTHVTTETKDEFRAGLVGTGYVMAVLMPLIGFILGIVIITRPQKSTSKHGVWIVVLSCATFVVGLIWLIYAASHTGTSSPSTSY